MNALFQSIEDLQARGESAAAAMKAQYGDAIAIYNAEVVAAVHQGISQFRAFVSDVSGGNSFCEELMRNTEAYLDWLQWTLWDLPGFAAIIGPDPALFRRELSACCLIYFAGRIMDDFLDRHYLYRGKRETLLAKAPEGLTVAIASMLFMEGVSHLGSAARPVMESMKRVWVGILMEHSAPESWDEAFYARLIGLKNVDYWRIVYAALDPDRTSPLYPFLCGYYALAQKLNDAQDYARDAGQARPNLVSLLSGIQEAESRVGRDLLDLEAQASALPGPERLIALAKLAETCAEARRSGLFVSVVPSAPEQPSRLGITWQSQLGDISQVLESTGCPICESTAAAALFRKQGFAYHRCAACDHVYVNPRLGSSAALAVEHELAGIPLSFWPGEKLFAAHWAQLLRRQAPGPRLLDVRFEPGIFPRAARAAGFQVYGAGDEHLLRPLFGDRIAALDLESGSAPWGSFDAIACLRSLDRFQHPAQVLRALRKVMNENGLLLLAVPDFDSLQFRIFGKRWDAINPLARSHIFCERSLFRLLQECGFEPLTRLAAPPVPHGLQTRWMRLLRQLEGDETGDLVVLARAAES